MADFKKKVKNLFDKYDTNKSGTIDRKEFAFYFTDIINSLEVKLPEDEVESIVNEGIEIFDANDDGVLQLEEFEKMIRFLIEEKGLKL